MSSGIGFLGFGCAFPEQRRFNDDPIFRNVRRPSGRPEDELFAGVRERRVLGPEESIEPLMIAAARTALAAAGVEPAQIDRLYGYSSISEYVVPNGLFQVHHRLGLPPSTLVVPVNVEFTTFITATILGCDAIAAQRGKHVLIVCGSGWTRHMDYSDPISPSIGDAAAAAVLGPSSRCTVVDYLEDVEGADDDYHGFTMKCRPSAWHRARNLPDDEEHVLTPVFHISEGGFRSFFKHGMNDPPRLGKQLLERNGVDPGHVTLIAHQASLALMAEWERQIRPREFLDIREHHGNMTIANLPVTLASCIDRITTDYILLISPGSGTHSAAMLLRR